VETDVAEAARLLNHGKLTHRFRAQHLARAPGADAVAVESVQGSGAFAKINADGTHG
jgi:hypothetical protein